MSETLSPNTKAILLLMAPLIAGRDKRSTDLLTPSEYRKLARRLRELNAQPADLLTPAADQLLGDCDHLIDKARLERLLTRGFLLSQAVERWQARAIWVVSRADSTYPQRLKSRLREDSPAVLYGCGDGKILDSGGLAVVGSRNVDDALIEYTQEIGRLAASAGRTLVSGGARGVDQAAMRGALEAGGRVTGVLADNLERTVMQREHRNMLVEDQLVLISPYDPSAGFNVGHAMQRNKVIYALADAALIVSADLNRGGTWAGATEQMEKLHLVPVFVRTTAGASVGLAALAKKGALPWPDPADADGLNAAIATPIPERSSSPDQGQLSFASPQEGDRPESTVADGLFGTVRSLVLRLAREPMKAADVARRLGVTEAQARKWLKRLVEEGALEKRKKPVRYSIPQSSPSGTEGSSGPGAATKPTGSRK
jgi:predicted Rossmann fold nucleotide-binding protein DprA/Smf involved in DNA uptake